MRATISKRIREVGTDIEGVRASFFITGFLKRKQEIRKGTLVFRFDAGKTEAGKGGGGGLLSQEIASPDRKPARGKSAWKQA